MSLGRALEYFVKQYEIAQISSYVEKPVSWALYQTWKWANSKEKPRVIGGNDEPTR